MTEIQIQLQGRRIERTVLGYPKHQAHFRTPAPTVHAHELSLSVKRMVYKFIGKQSE